SSGARPARCEETLPKQTAKSVKSTECTEGGAVRGRGRSAGLAVICFPSSRGGASDSLRETVRPGRQLAGTPSRIADIADAHSAWRIDCTDQSRREKSRLPK
ncbi:hypothetical protein THAOC_03820, partial [Thalassiosira oceanica]